MQDVEFADKFDGLSDEELAELCRHGVQDAFSALSVRYIFVIRKRISSFTDAALETDDLFQEGLIGLDNAVRTYSNDGGASFRTYAGVCIRNRMISALRKAQSSLNSVNIEELSLSEQTDLKSCSLMDPEKVVLGGEQLREIMEYLDSNLSDLEKSVLSEYLDGKTYDEISGSLNITRKACDNAMQRIRRKLKLLK